MSANTILYYKRKAQGVCVRCEAPRCGDSVLCETHLNWQRSTRKLKMPDDSPEALPCAPEPPRAPYQSDRQPVMEPIPSRCPKCQGCIHVAQLEWGEPIEWRCINCGKRPRQIPASTQVTYGAQLPCVQEAS